jgi:hypothetical protein
VDALCYRLGEFRELAAFVVSQRDRIPLEATGEMVAKTSREQLAVTAFSGTEWSCRFRCAAAWRAGQIHGEEGALVLTATSRASMQRQELNLQGACANGVALADLPVPDIYRWAPEGVPPGSPYNVANSA